MGICGSKTESDSEAIQRHKEIEAEIDKDMDVPSRKLLLLGAGECGKSTVLKQMRLRQDEFTSNELLYYKPLITGMVVSSMYALVQAAREIEPQHLQIADYRFEIDAKVVETIIQNCEEHHPVDKSLAEAIHRLWKTDGIKRAFYMRDQFHIHESTQYFLNDWERISAPSYNPSIQDVLNVRSATIGVQEVCFNEKETLIRVFDVGGQKSQRRKWIHVFDNVDAVIYICAVSEFNQMMREDEGTNRLVDSLNLFKEVVNNQYFTKISLILFLNKTDLFRQKIRQKLSINTAFPDYRGPNTYDDSMSFIVDKFETEASSELRKVITHETCAVDTTQIRFVLDGVADIILAKQVGRTGFD